MPVFKDDQEVYQYIGKLFQDLSDDPELSPKFRRADTIVQYRYSNPDSPDHGEDEGGRGRPGRLRPDRLEPEIVMTMEADTAHKFWLGKVNVTMAMAKGQMKAKGPVAKILKLVPLVKPVFPRYQAMVEEAGRDDLLKAA